MASQAAQRFQQVKDFARILEVLQDQRYQQVIFLIERLGIQELLCRELKGIVAVFETIETTLGYSKGSLRDKQSRKEFANGQFPPPRTGKCQQKQIEWSDAAEKEEWMRVFVSGATMLVQTAQKKHPPKNLASSWPGLPKNSTPAA
jgi:hypothetical protein